MKKFFTKYTIIIFVNLFAFLSIGHILDVIFGAGGRYKMIFLIISIVPLLIISQIMIKKTLSELDSVDTHK